MRSRKRLLIVEAHSDDSAISASGFLEKFRNDYEMHFVLIAASSMTLHHFGYLERSERLVEFENYVRHFGGQWHCEEIPFDAESRLDTIPKRDVVFAIESVIASVEPDVLIMQGPSFHHDHTIVYEATIAATRPTARHYPKEMYIMENPTYVHSVGPSTDFAPDLYVSLDEVQMNDKLELFARCFPSQVREGPNYLSADGIRAWARYRGIEARCLYAEAFRTYKRVI
jgi:LmbE family N-acetylglucosaminyl deacetylase